MMLALGRKKAFVSAPGFVPGRLLDQLSDLGFKPVIHSFKKGLLNNLGLADDPQLHKYLMPTSADFLVGDVFFPAKGVCLFLKVFQTEEEKGQVNEEDIFADPSEEPVSISGKVILEAGEVSPFGEVERLTDFLAAVGKCFTEAVTWEEVAAVKAKHVKGRSAETPSERDIELAALLSEERLAPLYNALEKKNSMVIDEFLSKQKDPEEIEYFIDKLLEIEFLSEEIVVYCTETGQPTIRARDRAALNQLASAGIKCMCGKSLDSEDVHRMAFINESGKKKMNPSYVSRIFLINTLIKVGLANKDIVQMENGHGGSLIFASFDGIPVLFYLIDPSQETALFKPLEEALKQIPGAHVVIFSESDIDGRTLETLKSKHGASDASVITSLNEMNAKMADLLKDLRRQVAGEALAAINAFTRVDIASLTIQRLSQEE